jgi:tetratricopeptide (TPR) repeat protein
MAVYDGGSRQSASAAWDQALQMDPKNICFISEATRAALALGDRGRARRLAQSGLDLYPNFALFHAQLGACFLAEGRLTESAQLYEKAVHADWHGNAEDEARAYAALASCQLGQKHWEYARDLARQACALQPQWPAAALFVAQALEGLGDYDDAYHAYEHVLTMSPHEPSAVAGIQRVASRLHRSPTTVGSLE